MGCVTGVDVIGTAEPVAVPSREAALDPAAPRAEHRGVHDDRYGAYRRRFDGVEGSLG
jgi:hypothetical protein